MRKSVIAALAALTLSGPAAAQGGLFAPVVVVNGQAVNAWQIEQRARFLGLLRAPNATLDAARDVLVDETLQAQAARAAGIEVTDEQLQGGLAEFTGRFDLEPEQFLTIIEGEGIAPETFRDFVRNGLLWRQLVQRRFGAAARPSETEVRRALARDRGDAGDVRVQLSEIAVAQTPETRDAVAQLFERLQAEITGPASFEAAARRISQAPSARAGGRIAEVSLSQLPGPIARQLLVLAPGEVTEPVDLGGFVAMFLLRSIDDSGVTRREVGSLEYAEYRIPGGRTPETLAQAGRILAVTDSCDDLYGQPGARSEAVLRRVTAAPGELPADLRQVLAALDENEASTLLVAEDGSLRVIMLCARNRAADGDGGEEEALEAAGRAILNQRLESYAAGYLAELRAEAIITDG